MPKRTPPPPITTSGSRNKLKARWKPYYWPVKPGLQLGFRRHDAGGAWVMKRLTAEKSYATETFARAILDDADDDARDLDLDQVTAETELTFDQAFQVVQRLARERSGDAAADGPLTIGQLVREHVEEVETTKKSAPEERSAAEAWIIPLIGDKDARTITTAELKAWRDKVAKSGRKIRTPKGEEPKFGPAPRTAEEKRKRRDTTNRIMHILKAALERAFKDGRFDKDGRVTSNLAWKRLKPFPSVARSRDRWLEVEEIKKLILAAEPCFQDMVRAGAMTGARWGDLCRLNVGDFDRKNETIAFTDPKGGKSYVANLKDDSDEPGHDAVTFFKTITAGRKRSEPMFVRADGKRWARHQQRRPMQRAVERAGLEGEVTFHTIRHSFGAGLAMSGEALHVVARAMGHASTMMAEKHYGHMSDKYLAKRIKAALPRLG